MDQRYIDDFFNEEMNPDEEMYLDEYMHPDLYPEANGMEIEPQYMDNPQVQEINEAIDQVKQELPEDPYYLNDYQPEVPEPIIELEKKDPYPFEYPGDIEIWLVNLNEWGGAGWISK